MKVDVKGPIIENDFKWIYEQFNIQSTCPNDIHTAIEQAKSKNEQLDVYINSGGGSVFPASEIYTALQEYGNIHIYIVGIAGSAASMIAMAGYAEISAVGQIMIHNAYSFAQGDYRDMNHSAEVLYSISESIANAYCAKTKRDKAEIMELMNKETWLTPEKALEMGFVDEIMKDTSKPAPVSQFVASVGSSVIPYEIITKMQAKKQKALAETELLKLKEIKE